MSEPAGAQAWRWRNVLQSPHRVGFLSGMAVLVAASAWWALVQADRSGLGPGLRYAVSPTLTHATIMVFGFMPAFFAGFLFTAGPRWLELPPQRASSLVAPLGVQAIGWLSWLLGAHLGERIAQAGLALVLAGFVVVTWRFAALVRASMADDRVHARVIAGAHIVGCACLAGVLAASLAGDGAVAIEAARTGLWWFIVPVFLAAADRLIPFFSADALPAGRLAFARHSLALLLALAALEGASIRVTWPHLQVAVGLLECVATVLLLALAIAWTRVKRLASRLLVMFHTGLLWLALSLLLAGAGRLLTTGTGEDVLPLAGLHALAMGGLGSLMLAMVSRVSAGHGGRPDTGDAWLWGLFCLLQVAVVLRVAAAVVPLQGLLTVAALGWAVTMLAWGVRHADWYGRPRFVSARQHAGVAARTQPTGEQR
ncbi:NnrS family protein [Ramlibacter sp. G-1-2-2]|uniref:NnrS family protein n=1 Tax=Ramlibacter agri TaxID=2728837 RepID=A0A848HGQ4_9BURK|nr:NnrS family protein [Ramlibacter agri]